MANFKYHTKIYVKEICRLILYILMTSFHSNYDLLLTSCLIIVGMKRTGQCHYVCIDKVVVKIKHIPKSAFLKQKFPASEKFDGQCKIGSRYRPWCSGISEPCSTPFCSVYPTKCSRLSLWETLRRFSNGVSKFNLFLLCRRFYILLDLRLSQLWLWKIASYGM